MDNTLALLTAIAALVTAIITLLMVVEMRRQRKSMYRPDFAVLEAHLNAFANREHIAGFSNGETAPVYLGLSKITIPIANVGLGSGKNVRFKWSYEIDKFTAMIDFISKDQGVGITLSEDTLSIKMNESYPYTSWHNLTKQNEIVMPYVVPVSVQNSPIEVEVPPAYIALLTVWLHFTATDAVGTTPLSHLPQDLPDLGLTIECDDIGGDHIRQNFCVKNHIVMYSSGLSKSDTPVRCMSSFLQAVVPE